MWGYGRHEKPLVKNKTPEITEKDAHNRALRDRYQLQRGDFEIGGCIFLQWIAFPTYLVKTSEIDDLWQQIQMVVRWERGSGRIKTGTDVEVEKGRAGFALGVKC